MLAVAFLFDLALTALMFFSLLIERRLEKNWRRRKPQTDEISSGVYDFSRN